jgi:hypothetical protein
MASKINKINVAELDFDNIKTTLTEYLRQQEEFTDYDFTGSGLSVLIDLLAYNTHYNAYYTNMIANEMFLDSAADRNNVVSRARQLGYIPSSSRGAEVSVNVVIDQPNPTSTGGGGISSLTIVKGHPFITTIEGTPYTFLAKSSVNMELKPDPNPTAQQGSKIFTGDVDLVEGIQFDISYIMSSNLSKKYIIPNLGVDVSSISVLVRDSVTGTSATSYTLASNLVEVSGSDTVYWLEEGPDGKYQLYFGDDIIGKSPGAGSVIQITYNICNGELGNGSRIFNITPIPYLYGTEEIPRTATEGAIVTTLSDFASGGASRESIGSIKYLAPLSYETQGRAVTAEDYKARLLQEYSDIDSIRVWGGEEQTPPDYGAVYISIKPKSGLVLTDSQKTSIIKDILDKNSVVSVRKTIVDPEYIHLMLTVIVKYDSTITALTQDTLKALSLQTLLSFGQTQLDQFESYFRYSSILRELDLSDSAITNSLVDVKLKKHITPTFTKKETHVVDFANPIYNPHSGHRGAITSTPFVYNDSRNSVVTIIDKGTGRLVLSEVGTGREVIRDIGSVDYDTGILTIRLNPKSASDNIISITVVPKHRDVVTNTNQILSLASENITIQMVDDSSSGQGTTTNPNYI